MTHPFDRDYFNGGSKVGGYAREGYWDYPVHWTTYRKVLERRPASVLELGCARGYVLKRLEDAGVRVRGLEISEHCRLTRVIDDVITWDITQTPWPVGDQEFDLCLSIAVLEHIPEDKLPAVFAEMSRTCRRGLHGIDLHDDDGFDKTHYTIRPEAWWYTRLPAGQDVVDKEVLEKGAIEPPKGSGVKLNLGSFTTMFHHGWRNLDRLNLYAFAAHNGYSFAQVDLLAPLPFDANTVDLIYACHVLEHLTYDDGLRLLKECRRTMKSGAVMRILVPDADRLLTRYANGTLDHYHELSPQAASRNTSLGKLWELLCAEHRAAYDWPTLEQMCKTAGFQTVERARFRQSRSAVMRRETFDLYPDLSLIVEVC